MPEYKLEYFALRARGEITRLLFHLNGIKFEDKRYTFEQWGEQKKKITFGQLPLLTIDGKEYTESGAIERFLAREFSCYGSNNQEAYEIDQVMGMCADLFEKHAKSTFEKDDSQKKILQEAFAKEHIPRYIGNINTLLQKKKSNGYCVGTKLSLGDLAIFHIVDGRLSDAELRNYPFVEKIVQNVRANPNIKAYLSTRPKTNI